MEQKRGWLWSARYFFAFHWAELGGWLGCTAVSLYGMLAPDRLQPSTLIAAVPDWAWLLFLLACYVALAFVAFHRMREKLLGVIDALEADLDAAWTSHGLEWRVVRESQERHLTVSIRTNARLQPFTLRVYFSEPFSLDDTGTEVVVAPRGGGMRVYDWEVQRKVLEGNVFEVTQYEAVVMPGSTIILGFAPPVEGTQVRAVKRLRG